jgi:GT2 family glycosyltransferase
MADRTPWLAEDMISASRLPAVDVIIPAYNEEPHLSRCLDDVLSQDYPPDLIRVCVIDAGSDDATEALARTRAAVDRRVTVLGNRGRLAPGQAMNVGLEWSSADLFARVDAHTYVAPDFLRCGVAALCADARIAVASGQPDQEGETRFGRGLALARRSRFGVGGSVYAERSPRKFVDTVQGGVFRRAAVVAVGGFHEDPAMSEDDELNWRLRRAGHLILLDRTIRFRYTTRSSWRAAFRQYRGYGAMRARAVREHPEMLRPRHLAPSVLLVALGGLAAACPRSRVARRGLGLSTAAYLAAAAVAALRMTGRTRVSLLGHVIAAFSALHAGFGVGVLGGLIRLARRR